MWRRIVHAGLVCVLAVPLGIAWAAVSVALGLALLAHRMWPSADWGNCWTFALVKWWRDGGYLACRPSTASRAFGFGLVPHVLWVKSLDGCELQQIAPTTHYTGPWMGLRVWYFHFVLRTDESDGRGDWRHKGTT